jgi:hypothetical protein
MNCANIFLVTFGDDDETKQVTDLLKERYADRSVNTFNVSYDAKKLPCLVKQEPESKRRPGDTGIYVIAHGAAGFTEGLVDKATRKAFLNWLLSLSSESRIRKLCFVTCLGIKESAEELDQPVLVSAVSATDEKIYVQHICQAITEIDTSRKLEGLMVAGYMGGVYLHKSVPEQPERRPGYKLTQKDKTEHLMHPTPKIKTNLTKKLKSYTENKMVFVLQDGNWRLGSLWEYTDNAELKRAFKSRGFS